MKQLKKGDRVLVRDNDAQEWREAIFEELRDGDRYMAFAAASGSTWTQCRHIDDFRTGDLVEFKSEDESEEWHESVYACPLPKGPIWRHMVYNEGKTDAFAVRYVRWRPSMPWADKEVKEELTLEQRIEALERKLNEQ